MKKNKLCLVCGCFVFLSFSNLSFASNDNLKKHIAIPTESYWSIAKDNNINFFDLLKLNNKTTNSSLDIGETVFLPPLNTKNFDVHIAVPGDSYFKISKLYSINFLELLQLNNATTDSLLEIGDIVILPKNSNYTNLSQEEPNNNDSFISHTVQSGDTLWNLSIQYGIPVDEILTKNNLTNDSILNIGMNLNIPVHNIPVKSTLGDEYGELLDWSTEANYVLPVNSIFKVIDFYTKKSFYMKRTTGSCHADCEPLTSNDSAIIKELWGGSFSWKTRPILIEYNGRTLACSMSSLPHAGNDSYPGGTYISQRSDNYGEGYNFDWVKNNSVDGVMDIHFLNSTKHSDGKIDPNHQKCVKIAAGLQLNN